VIIVAYRCLSTKCQLNAAGLQDIISCKEGLVADYWIVVDVASLFVDTLTSFNPFFVATTLSLFYSKGMVLLLHDNCLPPGRRSVVSFRDKHFAKHPTFHSSN